MPLIERGAFSESGTVFLCAEIYPRRSGTPHAVQVQTTVTSDEGKVLGHSATIPLANFSPGRYVLRMEGRGQVSGVAPVARELEFRVR